MSRVACIIPVVNTTDGLEATLLSVLESRPSDCEVLVVLNAPYDDPYQLQGEIQLIEAPQGSGVVSCINLGIAAANAPVVHTLACGMEVSPGWVQRAEAHFEDPRVAAVAPVVLDAANRELPLAVGVGYTPGGRRIVCRDLPADKTASPSVGPIIDAAFYRKSALESLGGGLPVALGDALADVDLALSLRSAGWTTIVEPECRLFGRAITESIPAGASWGLSSERLFWRHASQQGVALSLAAHPIGVLSELMEARPLWRAPAQIVGRLAGIFNGNHYREYRSVMALAQQCAGAVQEHPKSVNRASDKSAPMHDGRRRVDAPHQAKARPSAQQSAGQRRVG